MKHREIRGHLATSKKLKEKEEEIILKTILEFEIYLTTASKSAVFLNEN